MGLFPSWMSTGGKLFFSGVALYSLGKYLESWDGDEDDLLNEVIDKVGFGKAKQIMDYAERNGIGLDQALVKYFQEYM